MGDFVPWLVVGINALAFLTFGFDKWRARRNKRRVPESNLLLLAALTGCIGAWLAVSFFRHKTQKKSFLRMLWLATAINGIWIWLWLR